MAYPRFRKSRAHKSVRITSGDLTLNNASFTVIAGTLLAVEAQVGDDLIASLSARCGAEAVTLQLDAATIVASAITNHFGIGGGGTGTSAWYRNSGDTVIMGIGGDTKPYTVQSGDIVSGLVTVQLVFKATANKTLYANSNTPLDFWIKNLGPADD
jgi:hypothetical protein